MAREEIRLSSCVDYTIMHVGNPKESTKATGIKKCVSPGHMMKG